MKKLLSKFTGNEKQKLNRYGFMFLIMVVGLLFFKCKKDTIETPSEPLPSNPQVSLDYRDSFVGIYKGIYFNYNQSWNPPPPIVWSYSESPPVSYTINISKVAGAGNDSLVFSNQILEVMLSPSVSNVVFNDTFLIRSNGSYTIGFPGLYSDQLNFIGDSLKTNHIVWSGAMSTFGYGRKFKGKKIRRREFFKRAN